MIKFEAVNSDLKGMETAQFDAEIPGRDKVILRMEVKDFKIVSASLSGVGCLGLLKLLKDWRPKLKGALDKLPLPEGEGHAAVLLREVLLKAQGQWHFPYQEDELCHCRAIPAKKVDQAICAGFHTIEAVGDETSAGTACGSCQPDIKKVLEYRLRNT